MSGPKPVYLVSPFKGRVVTEHARCEPSGIVMEHAGFKGDEQKWILEFGEEPDTVALRSVSNNKYITPSCKDYTGRSGTGEKTYWKISYDEVRIPGAFRLSVAGGPANRVLAYVNMDGTTSMICVEGWNVEYTEHRTTWWFADPDGSPMSAKSIRAAADGEVASAKQAEESAAKHKAVEEREAALKQKEEEISDREAAAAKRDEESDAKQKALEERESALKERETAEKKDLQDREAALTQSENDNSSKQKSLDDREATLAQQEKAHSSNKKSFEDREAAFSQKEKDNSTNKKTPEDREAARQKNSAASAKGLEGRKAALAQQEKALKNRETTLEQHEKDSAAGKRMFERRKAALAEGEKDYKAKKKAVIDREAALAEKESKLTAEWDKKMKEMQGSKEASAQANGNPVGCGSKHYKPPRKLNRKIIGIVYE